MRVIFIIFILLNTACDVVPTVDNNRDSREGYSINPDTLPYIAEFENTYNTYVYNIPVTIRPITTGPIGLCITIANGLKEIILDDSFWYNDASEIQRKTLMFHELGHCIFNLQHNHFYLNDGCPGSIMHEYMPHTYCLERHWDYYLNELNSLIYDGPYIALKSEPQNKEEEGDSDCEYHKHH